MKGSVWFFLAEDLWLVGVLTNDCHLPNERPPSPGQPRSQRFLFGKRSGLVFTFENTSGRSSSGYWPQFLPFFAFFTRMPPHLADVLKWLYGRYKDTLQVLVRIFADFAEKIGFGLEDSANQSVFGHFASWVLPPCLLGSNAISGDFQSPSSPDYAD